MTTVENHGGEGWSKWLMSKVTHPPATLFCADANLLNEM